MKQYISGSLWALIERVASMVLGVATAMVLARKLGRAGFGDFSYAEQLAGLFVVLVPIGTQRVFVRELVRAPEQAGDLMRTSMVIRWSAAGLGLVLMAGLSLVLDGWGRLFGLTLCFGLMLGGSVFDAYADYFQAHLQYPVAVRARLTGLLLSVPLLIGACWLGAPMWAVALAFVLRFWIAALCLSRAYHGRHPAGSHGRFNRDLARLLLQDGLPLALSAIVVMIYTRTGLILVRHMQGAEAAGLYSAACRVYNPVYSILPILGGIVYPAIVKAKTRGEAHYWERLEQVLSLNVAIALAGFAGIAIFGRLAVRLFYGPAFEDSANILLVQMILLFFQGIGLAGSMWFITESQTMLALKRNIAGAVINVGLSLWLIPRWSGLGAAVASVVAYAAAMHFALYFSPVTRPLFRLQNRALTLVPLFKWSMHYARRHFNVS